MHLTRGGRGRVGRRGGVGRRRGIGRTGGGQHVGGASGGAVGEDWRGGSETMDGGGFLFSFFVDGWILLAVVHTLRAPSHVAGSHPRRACEVSCAGMLAESSKSHVDRSARISGRPAIPPFQGGRVL